MQNDKELKDAAREGALDLLDEIIKDFTAYGSRRPNQDEVTILKNDLLSRLEGWKTYIQNYGFYTKL